MTADLWALIHAERAALAEDLADPTDEQWATTSLCTELTVREVLAHLTSAASIGPLRWLAGVIRCRFDFEEQVARRLANSWATPRPRPRAVPARGLEHGLPGPAEDGRTRRDDRPRVGHPAALGLHRAQAAPPTATTSRETVSPSCAGSK